MAKTTAKKASQHGYPLLCFFCRRGTADRSNPRRFFSTLAYMLAQRHAGYRRALYHLLSDPDNAGIGDDTASEQYKRLFEDILNRLTQPPEDYLFVIDALDECGSHREQEELARRLLDLAYLVQWVKVLVTSRDELRINAVFAQAPLGTCRMSNIQDEPDTTDDIRLYLQAKLTQLHKLDPSSISPDVLDYLVSRAGGLFIWCDTLIRHLESSVNPGTALQRILSSNTEQSQGHGAEMYADLYTLYDQVLESAVTNAAELGLLRSILGLVVVSGETRALSCDAMASLLQTTSSDVHSMIRALHAVLYEEDPVPHRIHGAVRVCHNSFRDYIVHKMMGVDAENTTTSGSSTAAGAQRTGWQSINALNLWVADRALDIMLDELKFNICDLEGPPVLNTDIPGLDNVIAAKVSPALEYASRFWFYHISQAGEMVPEHVRTKVEELVGSVKMLYYLEVLSLLGALGDGARILFRCAQHFKVSHTRLIPRR